LDQSVFRVFNTPVSMIAFLNDLLNLFYPEVCASCGNALYSGERSICMMCRVMLPRTGFESVPDNAVEKQFWGKVQLCSAASLYHFHKGTKVQHLIHRLKYHGETEAGKEAGRLLGAALKESGRFVSAECVLPVPLHRKRLMSRGYNQSEPIASGIAEVLGIGCETDILERVKSGNSQTRKGRYERWENAGSSFKVVDPQKVRGRHFLIADDVITTGSTLSACAAILLASGASSVSVASLAFATR
jgi:ComF family protein